MKLNIKQLLRERQITEPFAFLTQNGIPKHVAVKLLKDDHDRIQYHHLMQLCQILWCTPNELFVLTPEELQKAPLPAGHPLHALKARPDAPDIIKKLRQLPLDKLNELDKFLDGNEQLDRPSS